MDVTAAMICFLSWFESSRGGHKPASCFLRPSTLRDCSFSDSSVLSTSFLPFGSKMRM